MKRKSEHQRLAEWAKQVNENPYNDVPWWEMDLNDLSTITAPRARMISQPPESVLQAATDLEIEHASYDQVAYYKWMMKQKWAMSKWWFEDMMAWGFRAKMM